ncbi:MAG: hypothetical protein RR235_08520 [Oscillospiraceae bacterium]
MNFTYEDFEKEARASGLYGQFSAADINLARQNPDVGMSILNYKRDYSTATTDDQRALANAATNSLRKDYGGYSGGTGGSGFYKEGASPSGYERPKYESAYTDRQQGLLDKLQGSSFSYDHDTDPSYSAYKKEYTREGERATRDALGSAAAATGGIPSTAAVTAAGQAGQYYASKLSDKVPELRQQAYNEYMQNRSADLAILDALNSMESKDYSKYTNDRNFDYSQILDNLEFNQGKEQTAWERDEYKNKNDRAELEERAADLAALGDYSLYAQLGYNDEEIALLKKGWKATNPKLDALLNPLSAPVYSSGVYKNGYGGGGAKRTPPGDSSKNDMSAARLEIESQKANGATDVQIRASAKKALAEKAINESEYNSLMNALYINAGAQRRK